MHPFPMRLRVTAFLYRVLPVILVSLIITSIPVFATPSSECTHKPQLHNKPLKKIPITNLAASATDGDTSFTWHQDHQGQYVTSLTTDSRGSTWVGTEDCGVWKFDHNALPGKEWQQFDSNNGLGDDSVYAIGCDSKGRIWAGTSNHGISIFNGEKWKSFDYLFGKHGVRVFAISKSPKDNDMWIATDEGLIRYSEVQNVWRCYTRFNGLPSNQVKALAFDKDGRLYIGTECDGVASSSPDDNY